MNNDVAARAEAPVSLWRRSVIGVSWSVCATTLGLVAMAVRAEHGSIVYFFVGLEVAALGTAACLLLPSLASFRGLSATERSVALAAASALPSIAYTAFSLFSHSSRADSTGALLAFLAPLALVAVVIASASAVIAVRLEMWWDR